MFRSKCTVDVEAGNVHEIDVHFYIQEKYKTGNKVGAANDFEAAEKIGFIVAALFHRSIIAILQDT